MRWILASVGSPKLAFAKAGINEYAGRIRRFARLDFVETKAAPRPEIESAALLSRTEHSWRVVLDGAGKPLTSREWADMVGQCELTGRDVVSLIIGGAEGHAPTLKAAAALRVSLGPLTLQHELAQVVVLEQLYRAYSILRGMPYHRE